MSSENVASATAATPFNPELDAAKNLTDFASDAYLQRGRLLDTEVRTLVEQIELSNSYLEEINKLIAEANKVLFDTDNYSATTWQSDFTGADKTITLENGYGIVISAGGNLQIKDSKGNSLAYSGGVLIPTQAGGTAGNGVALNGNTSIILEDGTKVTLNVDGSNAVTSLVISRGNQAISVNGVNGTPTVDGPNLNGQAVDAATTDGDILVVNGGVHSLLVDGQDVPFYDTSSGIITDAQKNFINNQLKIDIDLSGSLTEATWKDLKDQLTLSRDNLTGSNQLQTVQLQSALTRYNQNFDAMSNSQNKIYALLKDILGNLK